MQKLSENSNYNDVLKVCQELYQLSISDYIFREEDADYTQDASAPHQVHPSIIFMHRTDSWLDADCFAKYPMDEDEVEWNQKFIKKVNGYIDKLSIPQKIDWDKRFLKVAAGEINTWSKDPSTKVSAAIFRGKYLIASSYNGFPPGIEDTVERLNNRELKYKLVQHAEANAIATCSRLGISTEGCTMALTHFPCSTCAGLMVSAGIKKLVVQTPNEDFLSRWAESVELGQSILKEAGVEVVYIDLGDDK